MKQEVGRIALHPALDPSCQIFSRIPAWRENLLPKPSCMSCGCSPSTTTVPFLSPAPDHHLTRHRLSTLGRRKICTNATRQIIPSKGKEFLVRLKASCSASGWDIFVAGILQLTVMAVSRLKSPTQRQECRCHLNAKEFHSTPPSLLACKFCVSA